MDLETFFDVVAEHALHDVNHDCLMARVARKVRDSQCYGYPIRASFCAFWG